MSAIVLLVTGADAAEPDPRGAYVVLEIATPLQKKLAGGDLTAIALVNGDAILNESGLKADGIDVEAFQSGLAALGQRADSSILLTTRTTTTKTAPGQPLLDKALKGVAHEARFRKIRIGRSFDSGRWEEKIDQANRSMIGQPDAEENPVSVESFVVFPVRTFASSYLSGHADAIVFVRTKISAADTEVIPAADREPLKAAFDRLKLPRRERLLIDVVSTGEGRKAVDRAAESYRELGESLGFGAAHIRNTPQQ